MAPVPIKRRSLHRIQTAPVLSVFLAVVSVSQSFGGPPGASRPLIFPAPRELAASGHSFVLDDHVTIAVPAFPSDEDLFLAGSLAHELGDRFGLHLKTERLERFDSGKRIILMGSITNPLISRYCANNGIDVSAGKPRPEGYILRTDASTVVVAGSDDRGAFYGLQSLRQLANKNEGQPRFEGVYVRDWPDKPFRGIRLYLPGRNNIPFFKRFIRDFMALYKYNTLIMEMNASMRLERHPELNAGWEEFVRDTNYSRRNYPPGPIHEADQNSSHQDTADGGFLEKEEVADLARWVKRYHIELIPELPAFTHSYYLLTRHKELSEVPGQKWPDTYCPSNPKSYELLFDVYAEYIDALKPRMIHAGHDELFMPVGLCPRCKDKDIGERYGEDVRKIHDYLASKGIQMAIWGDMLLQDVRGKGLQKKQAPDGWTYYAPGGMTPEQVERLIPKDVLIFNWFWHKEEGEWGEDQAEHNEARLDEMGFKQIYGNFTPGIERYDVRAKRSTLLGGAPSAWFATTEFGFGKDLLSDFLGCSNILWSGEVVNGKKLSGTIQAILPEIRVRFRGEVPPSLTETSIVPVNIASSFNMEVSEAALDVDLKGAKSGKAIAPFDLGPASGKNAVIVGADGAEKTGLPKEVVGIKVGEDATSLIFLHASAKPATNKEMFRLLWDPEDTADLLGWYEVVYEDGFETTIPIRYGVNIAEWNWDKRQSERDYCYGADAVPIGGQPDNPITFFAFEWTNPRLGKVIKEVRLKGTTGFKGGDADFTNDYGPVITKNAVILKAISLVKKRG